MNFEHFSSTSIVLMTICLLALALVFSALTLHWKRKFDVLSDQLSRCKVLSGNLEEECQRLAWCAVSILKSLKQDLETRSGYFQRQRRETPHKDHEQRAIGYQEASDTIGLMIEEMKERGGGEQKIKVDL